MDFKIGPSMGGSFVFGELARFYGLQLTSDGLQPNVMASNLTAMASNLSFQPVIG